MTTSQDLPSVNELVAQLKQQVAQRRADDFYPSELEEELNSHFHRIARQRVYPPDYSGLWALVDKVEQTAGFDASKIELDSRVPGGSALHRSVGKAVSRQTGGILEQVQEFATSVRELARSLVAMVEDPNSHVHADLVGHVDAIYERLADYERDIEPNLGGLQELTRRIERLEAIEANRNFRPTYSNDAFEAAFRGSRAQMLEMYRELTGAFDDCSPVLDIGCGRGEILELLRDRNVEASGVEIDPALVDECNDLGLKAELGDGLAILAAAGDGTLGGISLIQVVEHLSQQQVVDLVMLAAEKLRPGGRMLIETVNPQSLYVYARAFYIDPTHVRPVHPGYLGFLFEQAGFESSHIEWRSHPNAEERLVDLDDPAANANVQRLNELIYGPQDYALIATR